MRAKRASRGLGTVAVPGSVGEPHDESLHETEFVADVVATAYDLWELRPQSKFLMLELQAVGEPRIVVLHRVAAGVLFFVDSLQLPTSVQELDAERLLLFVEVAVVVAYQRDADARGGQQAGSDNTRQGFDRVAQR